MGVSCKTHSVLNGASPIVEWLDELMTHCTSDIHLSQCLYWKSVVTLKCTQHFSVVSQLTYLMLGDALKC